jgi:hypothetical protein
VKNGDMLMAKRSEIGKLASAKTKKEFADKLSSYTTLTAEEIKQLFPKKSDREELMELITIVNSDASDKEKKAKLVEKISKVSGAVIAIGKKFVTGM